MLPGGMCIKYLKDQRIAQNAELMKDKDDGLVGFYKVGFKLVQVLLAGGALKKSNIKRWLGKPFNFI